MNAETWNAVDRFISAALVAEDEALAAAVRDSAAAGLPEIQVAPNQGKLLYLLAKLVGARRVLEIGTLGGYSTIWLARALPPDGRLLTLELDGQHAAVARANLNRAGVGERVEIRIGPALDALAQLEREAAALDRAAAESDGRPAAEFVPFDLVFLDADKESYPAYLERSVGLCRPGAVLIADNVVRKGEVANPGSADERVRAVQRFYEQLAHDPRLEATAIQTVGVKGYDGFALARVKS